MILWGQQAWGSCDCGADAHMEEEEEAVTEEEAEYVAMHADAIEKALGRLLQRSPDAPPDAPPAT